MFILTCVAAIGSDNKVDAAIMTSKAPQEISEELSIDLGLIRSLSVCDPYVVEDQAIDRIWYVYPVLTSLKSEPNIILDWEHTDYRWIQPSELTEFEHVKDFDKSVNLALSSRQQNDS